MRYCNDRACDNPNSAGNDSIIAIGGNGLRVSDLAHLGVNCAGKGNKKTSGKMK